MYKVVIIGAGWAGCLLRYKESRCGGCLLERTDMILGLGNVGGIMEQWTIYCSGRKYTVRAEIHFI